MGVGYDEIEKNYGGDEMRDSKAILFDMDGTLLDSRRSVMEAVYYVMSEYGEGRFSQEEVNARFGEPMDRFLMLFPEEKRAQIFEEYVEVVRSDHDRLVKLFPGVRESLDLLRNEDYVLALVSNNGREFVGKGLRKFGLENYFDSIVTLDDVRAGKPSPEPIRKALGELGVKESQTLMVGDSIYDVLAALAADVDSAVLDWYGVYPDNGVQPDHYFHDMKEFMKLFSLEKAV